MKKTYYETVARRLTSEDTNHFSLVAYLTHTPFRALNTILNISILLLATACGEGGNTQTPQQPEGAIVFASAELKGVVVGSYDTNGDGEISADEALKVSQIDLTNSTNITTLEDLAYFSGLATLNASNTAITSIDLSKNTALQTLNVSNTAITSLDVSMLPNLRAISIEECSSLTMLRYNSATQSEMGWLQDIDSSILVDANPNPTPAPDPDPDPAPDPDPDPTPDPTPDPSVSQGGTLEGWDDDATNNDDIIYQN